MSNGGYISNRLACEAADLVAAVGPVSATIVIDPCAPSRAIPVMMFNGTSDFLVPYNGGLYQSAPQSFADWAAHNNCTDAPEVSRQVGGATCETYGACDDDVSVTLCTIEGMGHCWPGNPVCPFGTPNVDMNASEAVWQFFNNYSLP
jgi:polyhydroxybutyrate depolymerase